MIDDCSAKFPFSDEHKMYQMQRNKRFRDILDKMEISNYKHMDIDDDYDIASVEEDHMKQSSKYGWQFS